MTRFEYCIAIAVILLAVTFLGVAVALSDQLGPNAYTLEGPYSYVEVPPCWDLGMIQPTPTWANIVSLDVFGGLAYLAVDWTPEPTPTIAPDDVCITLDVWKRGNVYRILPGATCTPTPGAGGQHD